MGYKHKDFPYELRIGRDINSVSNLAMTVKEQEPDFDFILIDLCHSLNMRTSSTIDSRQIALTRSDTCIKSFYWGDFLLAKVNSYLTDCDSPYEHVRLRSEAIMC